MAVLTRNAADPEQVAYAARHNRTIEQRRRDDMRTALTVPACRRVLMWLLYEARCDFAHAFEDNPELTASTYDPGAKIHYHNGRRDLGLLLQGAIHKADPKALVAILTEQLASDDAQTREIDAAHVTTATAREGERHG